MRGLRGRQKNTVCSQRFAFACFVLLLLLLTQAGTTPSVLNLVSLGHVTTKEADKVFCARHDALEAPVRNMSSTPDIIFLIMGQAKFFSRWYDLLHRSNKSSVLVSYLFGAYDTPFTSEELVRCNQSASLFGDFQDCQAHFMPGTTWTQGRNFLASKALLLEKQRRKTYDFWIFSDDDVKMQCLGLQIEDQRSCWQKFADFVGASKILSSKITTISSIREEQPEVWGGSLASPDDNIAINKWVGISTQDGMLAAFQRDRVPYMLPYALPEKGLSEWISQAALFCVMETCFPSSIASFSEFRMMNELHREYPRDNFNVDTIMSTIRNNFGAYIDFEHCGRSTFAQIRDIIGPYDSARDLITNIPPPNLGYCAPLLHRFADWENSIITLPNNLP